MAAPAADATVQIEKCPASAPFFGFMGVTAAIVFASTCVRGRIFAPAGPSWPPWGGRRGGAALGE